MLTFMMFRAILVVIQGWSSKGLRDVIYWLSCNWNLKENLGTHLRDNHAYKLSGDFELFWTLEKLGETNP